MDPRRIAGLLDAPGCRRRLAVDVSGIEPAVLAAAVGAAEGGQSPYARERDGTFAQLALARLPELAARHLGVRAEAVVETDELPSGAGLWSWRAPKLRLGDTDLTVDRVLLVGDGTRLHPIETRSYACLDGQADPTKVAGTARELAVTVAALRQAADEPDQVSSACLLVLPRNFGLNPVGTTLDVAPQLRRLRWVLDRLNAGTDRISAALEGPELVGALGRVPARFGDGCPSCAVYPYCRGDAEQSGAAARAGATVANLCGPVGLAADALALAHGDRVPGDETEHAIATELSRAALAYTQAKTRSQEPS
ncbi:hypothetical protein QEZ54_02685 [Catellatospora sp. KI3]|uniref:hypothetical protein n=1 Tax=Catellatospora sp. KI3 TaxID=3041620 RepID=UPI002482509C|nr:hypothetical protein [Catellatospora sp. KI3]MDI1459864.1 hypothetical protein [Catellatospora sp. KI3]